METKIKSFFLGLLLTNYLMLGGFLLFPQIAAAAPAVPPANTPKNTKSADPLNPRYQMPPVPYQGAEASIRQFLCVPGSGTQDLPNCVNRLYRFGGAIGAFAAVFFIALAGYFYIVGGDSGKTRAKTMIISVIAGLVIIFTSFIFLRQINPALTEFRSIQPPFLSGVPGAYPDCSKVGIGETCLISGGGGIGVGDGGGGYVGGNVTGTGGKVCSAGKDQVAIKAKCSGIPSDWQAAITAASRKYGIDEKFIKAVISLESSWNPNAGSEAGASGLMQLMPATAQQLGCGGQSTNPIRAIDCGTKYLAQMRDKFNVTGAEIWVGYNDGGGFGPSPNCPGKKVWQCPFSNKAQTACNDAYAYSGTRDGVVTIVRLLGDYNRCR